MSTRLFRRRRSDAAEFIDTDTDIDARADEIFENYVGERDVVIDGRSGRATFFDREYCPD